MLWGGPEGLLPLGVACVGPAEADLQHWPHQALSPPALQLKVKVKVTQLCPTLRLHGLYSPWNSPGQNTGVGSRSLLQGIFPTQGSNPGLLRCRRILHQLSHQGRPRILEWVADSFSRDLPDPGIELGSPALQANSLPDKVIQFLCLICVHKSAVGMMASPPWSLTTSLQHPLHNHSTRWLTRFSQPFFELWRLFPFYRLGIGDHLPVHPRQLASQGWALNLGLRWKVTVPTGIGLGVCPGEGTQKVKGKHTHGCSRSGCQPLIL